MKRGVSLSETTSWQLVKGFCSLASGSKGNCMYIGTSEVKILIDAGISGKQTREKLFQIGVSIEEIDAILVTHDHTDHIQGLKILAYKYGIPIFCNQETAKGIVQSFGKVPKFKIFTTGETFCYADMEIHPFSIPHDTLDPVAFTIHVENLKLGICTDLGFATSHVKSRVMDCDYLHIEANHQPSMVWACPRPQVYKQRVTGNTGHLSNEACAELICHAATSRLKQVHLAHLSSECNDPQIALDVIGERLQSSGISVPLVIAPQYGIGQAVFFS